MVAHTDHRWKSIVELRELPSEPTSWPAWLAGFEALQGLGPMERVLFVYDAKAAHDTVHPERARRPFKYPVSYDTDEVENFLTALFGDASIDNPDERSRTILF